MIREKDLDIKDLTNTIRVRHVLSRIKKNGSRYIVKENGMPLAMLLPLEDVVLRKSEKERAWQDLFQLLDTVHARNAHIPTEEVEADVEAAIREARRGRK